VTTMTATTENHHRLATDMHLILLRLLVLEPGRLLAHHLRGLGKSTTGLHLVTTRLLRLNTVVDQLLRLLGTPITLLAVQASRHLATDAALRVLRPVLDLVLAMTLTPLALVGRLTMAVLAAMRATATLAQHRLGAVLALGTIPRLAHGTPMLGIEGPERRAICLPSRV